MMKVTALVTYEINDCDNAESAIDILKYVVTPSPVMEDVHLTALTVEEVKQERELF